MIVFCWVICVWSHFHLVNNIIIIPVPPLSAAAEFRIIYFSHTFIHHQINNIAYKQFLLDILGEWGQIYRQPKMAVCIFSATRLLHTNGHSEPHLGTLIPIELHFCFHQSSHYLWKENEPFSWVVCHHDDMTRRRLLHHGDSHCCNLFIYQLHPITVTKGGTKEVMSTYCMLGQTVYAALLS